MSRRRRIYEGKAKVCMKARSRNLIQHFKDDATAFNAKKHQIIEGKASLNNRISEVPVSAPQRHRGADPFHPPPQHAQQLIREVEIVPLEVVCGTCGGIAVRNARHRGRHPAAALDHRFY